MSDDVMQLVQFQLIRPDGNLLWSAVVPMNSMPEPGRQFAYAVDRPEWWVAVDGGLEYDQQTGWARVPDADGSAIGAPWIWRYRESGGDWITIAEWPKSGE